MDQENLNTEFESDVRDIILTIWPKRWLIIGITIGFTLISFIVTTWVIPKEYEAEAFVMVKKPVLSLLATGTIETVPTAPDITNLADVSMSQVILDKVTSSSEVAAFWPDEGGILVERVEAGVIGSSQIRLKVTYNNPVHAATLANVWANQFVDYLIMNFGYSSSIQAINARVSIAEKDYLDAQSELEEELSQNKAYLLGVELENQKQLSNCIHSRYHMSSWTLSDLDAFKQGLLTRPDKSSLTVGEWLALTTLEQRTLASQTCSSQTEDMVFQIESENYTGMMVSETLKAISQMQDVLGQQQLVLLETQMALEPEILSLEQDLESALFNLDEKKRAVEQAELLYSDLSLLAIYLNAVESLGSEIFVVSLPASVPVKESSPDVIMNMGIAFAFGLVAGVLYIFVGKFIQNTYDSLEVENNEVEK